MEKCFIVNIILLVLWLLTLFVAVFLFDGLPAAIGFYIITGILSLANCVNYCIAK